MDKNDNLTIKQQIRAIAGVAILSFKIAPFSVIFKLLGSFVNAILPIATTFFAARTTTYLAEAYSGNNEAKAHVLLYVILTVILGLFMTIWSSLDNYIQAKMRYVVETRISNAMFEHFLSLDFWRYDDKETADLYDRAQKFSNFYTYVFDRIAAIVSQIIAIVTSITALVIVNYYLTIAIFIAVLPGIYIQFKLSRKQIKLWNENVEVRRQINLIEWSMLQPQLISELRLYGMVNFLIKLRSRLRDKDEKKRVEIERDTMPLILLSNFLEAGAELASLIWITLQIIARKQPLGQFLYVQQMVSRAISSGSVLVSTLSSIDEDIANLFDYEKFMKLPIAKTGSYKLEAVPNKITFQNVSFHYPSATPKNVLRNINIQIEKNQHIAIVGENGAGKTTLIKLLTGLYLPTDGQLLFDDIPIEKIDISSWHQYLGVLQQEFIRYNFATALDNIRYGNVEAKFKSTRLEQALKDAEAHEFISKLPRGIDSYINNWMEDDNGNKGVDLSGGQWQRIALARNFFRNAPVIILDEPTSAIDALAEARIFKHLFENTKRTVITISHRLSTIKKADIIYMLQDGEIVETGTHDELIEKKGHFFKMFESQIKG